MRRKAPKRRVSCAQREGRSQTTALNERWSMDFLSDELYDGSRIRILTLVDNHSRESLVIRVGPRIRGRDVAAVLQSDERAADDIALADLAMEGAIWVRAGSVGDGLLWHRVPQVVSRIAETRRKW